MGAGSADYIHSEDRVHQMRPTLIPDRPFYGPCTGRIHPTFQTSEPGGRIRRGVVGRVGATPPRRSASEHSCASAELWLPVSQARVQRAFFSRAAESRCRKGSSSSTRRAQSRARARREVRPARPPPADSASVFNTFVTGFVQDETRAPPRTEFADVPLEHPNEQVKQSFKRLPAERYPARCSSPRSW
jgi:hypothetical protein